MKIRDVLLTGATGFVGAHVAEAFAGHAGRLRALVRSTSRTERLRELGVEIETASFQDAAALRRAVQGAEVVVHLAALTHARTQAELDTVNADATRALLDAILAVQPRPRRLVYMSSLAAAGAAGGEPLRRDDEPRPLTAYGRSKLAGERVVLAAADQLEIVVLRAPAVYGPRDPEMLRFFRLARLGVLPVPSGPARPLQLVYVKDLAEAVVLAAVGERARGVYHVAEGRAYPWAEVCRILGRVAGRPVWLAPLPGAVLRGAAALSEWGARLAGRSTMFNRDKARELLAPGWLCETEAARTELGFEARTPLEQGLRETWDWYRNEGWL